jgi:predicted RND superfamily exporter protein
MHAAFIAFYDRWILSHAGWVLLIILALLLALATQLDELQIDASADSLVLEGDADLDYFRQVSSNYSAEDSLLVTYQPIGDLLGEESLATLKSLRNALRDVSGVSSVTSILDVPLLQSPPIALTDIGDEEGLPTLENMGVDLEMVRREFRDSPIYGQLLVSADGRTSVIQINLERDERDIKLLQRRELLRALEAAGELTDQQEPELAEAERAYKEHAAISNERQSLLVEEVRGIVEEYRNRAQLFVGGVPMIAADMVSFVRSDLVTFGAGILAFMLVVLAIIFRLFRWVVLPLLTCIVTATAMLGLLGWLDWRMTVISSNFVALLLIVTLAITIHLVVRYRELQLEKPDASEHELVLDTVRTMIIPCLYTSLTTAVAFVSLVVSGIRPVIDFGWMMTVGIAVALTLSFLVFPCVLVLLPRAVLPKISSSHMELTATFARITEKHGNAILVTALLLFLGSTYGISRLQVENRFIDYFHESTEIYQGMELLDAELGGTIPLDIIIELGDQGSLIPVFAEEEASSPENTADSAEDDGFFDDEFDDAAEEPIASDTDDPFAQDPDDPFADDAFEDDFVDDFATEGENFQQSYWFTLRGMNRIEAIHDYVDSLPETGKVLSLATTYDVVKQLLGNDVSDVELALVQKSLPESINSLLVSPYFDEDTEQVRITLRVKETSRELRRNDFLINLHKHLVEEMEVPEQDLRFTNMLVLYNNVLQSLFKSQILTLGAVFVAIMLMFMVLFRSFSLALIAIAPNLLAAGIVLGAMGLIGIPLDIMTITIAAIVVGIGVDHAIHYVHRFKREFPLDRDYLATMYRCHKSIGRALYYTSITVIAGFSILALSNFTPSIYFGLLTGLAMFASVIGSLLLLPQLIITFKPLGPSIPREEPWEDDDLASEDDLGSEDDPGSEGDFDDDPDELGSEGDIYAPGNPIPQDGPSEGDR